MFARDVVYHLGVNGGRGVCRRVLGASEAGEERCSEVVDNGGEALVLVEPREVFSRELCVSSHYFCLTYLERGFQPSRKRLQHKADLHALGHEGLAVADEDAALRDEIGHSRPGDFEPAFLVESVIADPRHTRAQLLRERCPLFWAYGVPVELEVAEEERALSDIVALEPVFEERGFRAHKARTQLGRARKGEAQNPVPDLVRPPLTVQVDVPRRARRQREVLFQVRG